LAATGGVARAHPTTAPTTGVPTAAAPPEAVPTAAAPPEAVPTAAAPPEAAPTRAAPPVDVLATDPVLGHADRVRPTGEPDLVAFTFDDGPSPTTTPEVLAALERYDVPAAFFVVSRRLVGMRSLPTLAVLAREEHEGFVIGSHSWTHAHLDRIGHRRVEHEVDDAVTTLALALGRPVGLYRPPYGRLGVAAARALARRGLTDVLWNVDSRDWHAHDPRRLRRQILQMILARHGGIVLMHDTKPITARVLPGVLDDLEATNCARLAHGDRPIVPVSIHYFLTDGGGPHRPGVARPVPPEVAARTTAYLAALPDRCAHRPVLAAAPAKIRRHHHARQRPTRRRSRRPRG